MFQIHFSCCVLYLYCKVFFREKFSCLTLNYKAYIHRFCCLSWFFCKSKKSAPVSLQHSSGTLTSMAKYLLKCIHSSMLTRQEKGILAIFPFWKLNIFICGFSTKVTRAFLASETMEKWRFQRYIRHATLMEGHLKLRNYVIHLSTITSYKKVHFCP